MILEFRPPSKILVGQRILVGDATGKLRLALITDVNYAGDEIYGAYSIFYGGKISGVIATASGVIAYDPDDLVPVARFEDGE